MAIWHSGSSSSDTRRRQTGHSSSTLRGGIYTGRERRSSLQLLRHLNAVALEAGGERAGGAKLLLDAGLNVAESTIEWRQVGSQAEDDDVHGLAALKSEMILGGFDGDAPKPFALVGGGYGELTQVAARAANLSVDASEKLAGVVLRQQDGALLHHGGDAFVVSPRAFKESLD